MIYIAGPLTDPDPQQQRNNVDVALRAYLELTRCKIGAICPHLAALDTRAFEVSYDHWITQGLKQLELCQGIWMLPRWHTSTGALTELLHARKYQIRVYYSLEGVLQHYTPSVLLERNGYAPVYFEDKAEYTNRLPI